MASLNTKLATTPNVSANYVLKATTSTTIGNSLIFDNGTNVGIGNTNTTYTFDVTGTGRFTGSLNGTSATFSSNLTTNSTFFVQNTDYNSGTATGTNFRIFLNASSGNTYTRLQTYTDGGATYGNLVINPLGGNVGIGPSNPTFIFDVETSNLTVGRFYSNATGKRNNILIQNSQNFNYGVFGVVSGNGTAGGDVYGLGYSASGSTAFTNILNWTSGGNVGIGTPSPSTLLQINTSARTSGTNVDILTLSDTVTGVQTSGFGVRILATSNNGQAKSAIAFEADGGTNNDTAIAFYTQFSAASLDRRMTINRNGNVGIGTTSPFNFGTGHRTLDIRGEGTTSIGALFVGNSDRTAVLGFYMNPNATGTVGTSSNHALQLVTNDAERMRITSGGIIYALNGGVDGTYQPMIGGMYNANNNETNLISTAVSSNATQSGFRFDVSNGAGSSARTTSMTINRSSVTIVGSLSKGSGSFKIDHPLESKKDTHHLVHSFVESPQANNVYRGKAQLVNGTAQVNLDEVSKMTEGTFVLLNREIHTYTSNETDWYAVRGNVIGNILHIECQNEESNAIVSWLVIGERQDKHMMDTDWTDENGKVIVEPLKQIITTEQQ